MFEESEYTHVPVEKVIDPPKDDGLFECFKDRYWAVKYGCILFYKGYSPQCNRLKDIVDRLARNGHAIESCEVHYYPLVYIPVKWVGEDLEPDLKDIATKMYIKPKRRY